MVKLGQALTKAGDDSEEPDYLGSTCYFKKHRGKTWRQVLDEDPEYVQFILTEADVRLSVRLRDELMWALEERI